MLLPEGIWRRVFRIGWVLLALNSIWTFGWTLYLTRQFIENPPPRIAAGLAELGWSAEFYFWFNVVFLLIYYFAFFSVATIIFLLRPNERMTLFASVFLMAFGTANAYIVAPEYLSVWENAPTFYIVCFLINNLLSWPLLFIFLSLFPDGRFVPSWIRYVAFYGFCFSVAWGFFPQAFGAPEGWLAVLVAISIVVVFVGSFYAQIWRYRYYSGPLQRQQTKWLVYGLAVIVLVTLAQSVLVTFVIRARNPSPAATVVLDLVGILATTAFILVPISIGFAILRYRLWDIDILIRRTLTYGILTALLVGIYFASVIALQRVLAFFTGAQQSELVTVLSTLGIAALFFPLRRGIQQVIDRRFYRNKYDAQKVLSQFAETVRDETDLERLTASLVEVVNETMKPRTVSVWLKKK
jgi:hypothetical protein